MIRKGYKKLDAFVYANQLIHFVYDLTNGFPKEELFVLTSV